MCFLGDVYRWQHLIISNWCNNLNNISTNLSSNKISASYLVNIDKHSKVYMERQNTQTNQHNIEEE